MILVDSSVWIDYFKGVSSPQADLLDDLLEREALYVGDLIVTEVLQGFRYDEDFSSARALMLSFDMVELAGRDIALKAADNYQLLRNIGVTVRMTIDTIIATRCIESGFELLYSDKNFDSFVEHLGLQSAMDRSRPHGTQ